MEYQFNDMISLQPSLFFSQRGAKYSSGFDGNTLLNKFDYTVSAGYENAESAIDLHEKKLVKNIEKFLNGKELRPAQKFMKMNRDKNLIVIAPVSYTHLDVYKRQIL